MSQSPPKLTDRAALLRNRKRATREPVDFLQALVANEVEERLTEVNRTFTQPAIVTGHPNIWQNRVARARILEDTETLPFSENSCDLIIHSMALHWANDPVGQLVQCRRALRPDGLLLATLFGGQTLRQLRIALAEAEAQVTGGLSPRIAPMAEIRDMGGLLQRAGFALPVADVTPFETNYPTMPHLMRDLRAMGEGNALSARLRRPTGRAVFLRAAEIYIENFADKHGRVPATFEVITLTGWAPSTDQPKPLRPGSAISRLSDALGTTETPLDPSER